MVLARVIKCDRFGAQVARRKAHAALERKRQGHASFIDVDDELRIMPCHGRRPNTELLLRSRHMFCTAFRHRPSAFCAIERHIDRTMVFGIGSSVSAGTGIVRRKNTTDKTNNRQAVLAVVTESINIPPTITLWAYWRIKARSCNTASAARMPASAAIGSPGPGCVLPPARKSPGIFVRALGLRNVDIHPCEALP
jgi:hypothetical protein